MCKGHWLQNIDIMSKPNISNMEMQAGRDVRFTSTMIQLVHLQSARLQVTHRMRWTQRRLPKACLTTLLMAAVRRRAVNKIPGTSRPLIGAHAADGSASSEAKSAGPS